MTIYRPTLIRFRSILLVALLIGGANFQVAFAQQSDQWVQDSVLKVQMCQFQTLIEECDQILADRMDPRALVVRGLAQAANQQADVGSADANKAFELAPDDPFVAALRVQTLFTDGFYLDAIESGKAAVLAFPDNWFVRLRLVNAYLAAFQPAAAKTEMDKALELGADSAYAFFMKAFLNWEYHQLEEAQQNFSEALTRNPKYLNALISWAIILIQFEQPEMGRQKLEQAIEIEPNYYLPYCELAKFEFRLEDAEVAKKLVEKAAERNDCWEVYFSRSLIANRMNWDDLTQGNYEPVLKLLDQAIELHPRKIQIYGLRSYVNSLADRESAAFADCERLEELLGDSYFVSASRGRVFNYFDDSASAVSEFEQALSAWPLDYGTTINMAYVYSSRGNTELHRVIYLTKAIEMRPSVGSTYYYRSYAYGALNKDDLAEKDRKKAKELGFDSSRFDVDDTEADTQEDADQDEGSESKK